MKAKDKALELGNKFYQGNPLVYSKKEHLDELQNAKTRALICVDSMIDVLYYLSDTSQNVVEERDYWQQVKTEIENL